MTRDITTGMTEDEATKAKLHDRPMMVYVYDADDEDALTDIETNRNFTNEKVAIGARFFDRMRIDSENAIQDRMFGGKLGRLPAIYFLRPNYDKITVIRGRFSSSKVFRAMCNTMKKDYDNCVSTVVKKQRELMKERIGLDKDKTKVDRLNNRIADEKSARRRKSLISERDTLEKKLSEAETQIKAREDALYELKLKEPKATA